MLQEFKIFIARGNVMDLAVGVIIGSAFQKIVDSIVNDLIMPVVGLATGGIDFKDKFVVIGHEEFKSLEEAKKAGAAVFAYGNFITVAFQFLILAFVVFLIIKSVNKMLQPVIANAAKPLS